MYHLILIPFITVIITQIIKLIIDAAKGKFAWNDLNSYGGMPSSHTSFVVALCVTVGYFEGWESAAFAISLVFAILIIRDAMGVRQQISLHAKILNQHLESLPNKQNYKYPHLRQRLGHTGYQVLAGATLGIILPIIYILIFV